MNPSQAFPEHPSLRWNATHYYIITFIITLLHYYITRCWLEILWKETASRTVTAKAGVRGKNVKYAKMSCNCP
jgi:hypothetical protein